MALRLVMHDAGAATLTKLLQCSVPAEDQRILPCGCGQQAHYRQLRTKTFGRNSSRYSGGTTSKPS